MDANLLKSERIVDVIKAVLPHRADYIEKAGPNAAYYLLSED